MTRKHHLALIGETIRGLQIGTPISKGLVLILLEPWPDLYRNAITQEGAGRINLLKAVAARIELGLD
jgi:hypothetical protein